MQIFDAILKQYMQLAFRNNQYKNNLQNLKLNTNISEKNIDKDVKIDTTNFNTTSKNFITYYDYNEDLSNIKNIYDEMEFDARRYNRNLDSQTGASLI